MTGANEFASLVSLGANIDAKARRIKEIEHETDVITHRCVEALHKTLITPIDSTQIHWLITRMDDVMDCIEAPAERIAGTSFSAICRTSITRCEIRKSEGLARDPRAHPPRARRSD